MAGFSPQGATFVYYGHFGTVAPRTVNPNFQDRPVDFTIYAKITGMSVESPVAEVTDMTSITDTSDATVIVPTGAHSGGSVSVDFIADATGIDMQTLTGSYGVLRFTCYANYTVARHVVLESVSLDVRTAELVRGSMKFRVSDYNPYLLS
jgi:hypothetical protein